MILGCIPNVDENDVSSVSNAVRDNLVGPFGPYVDRFEKKISNFTKAKYSVGVSSGTSALHLSLLSIDIDSNNIIIVPDTSFVATINVVKYIGSIPLLIDIDPKTMGMSVEALSQVLETQFIQQEGDTIHKKSKLKLGAVIPVDLYGHPVDMEPIQKLSQKYNFKVIQDASESLGAFYKEQPVGSYNSIVTLSFNANKIITTGGGGMVLTNDENVLKKIKHLSNQAKADSIEFEHDCVGYNYRLPSLNAALGVSQVHKLTDFIDKKRKIFNFYKNTLKEIDGVFVHNECEWAKSSYWMPILQLCENRFKNGISPLIQFLLQNKTQVRPVWKPLHTLKPFKDEFSYNLVNSVAFHGKSLCLPCSTSITSQELEIVVEQIKEYASRI